MTAAVFHATNPDLGLAVILAALCVAGAVTVACRIARGRRDRELRLRAVEWRARDWEVRSKAAWVPLDLSGMNVDTVQFRVPAVATWARAA